MAEVILSLIGILWDAQGVVSLAFRYISDVNLTFTPKRSCITSCLSRTLCLAPSMEREQHHATDFTK